MPVSRKRKGADWKHAAKTGICKTLKGKQVQTKTFHVPINAFDYRTMLRMFPKMRKHIAEVVSKISVK